jgi:hypothetical protein
MDFDHHNINSFVFGKFEGILFVPILGSLDAEYENQAENKYQGI